MLHGISFVRRDSWREVIHQKGNECNKLIRHGCQTINPARAMSNWLQAFLMACQTNHFGQFDVDLRKCNGLLIPRKTLYLELMIPLNNTHQTSSGWELREKMKTQQPRLCPQAQIRRGSPSDGWWSPFHYWSSGWVTGTHRNLKSSGRWESGPQCSEERAKPPGWRPPNSQLGCSLKAPSYSRRLRTNRKIEMISSSLSHCILRNNTIHTSKWTNCCLA